MKPKVAIVIGVVIGGFGIVASAMVNLELARVDERIFYLEHSYVTAEQDYEPLIEERNMLHNVLVPLFGILILIGFTLIVVGAIMSVKARDRPNPPQQY